ncbi:hypothetical protein FOL47_003181, partial [Perkinsus chesapeaki]
VSVKRRKSSGKLAIPEKSVEVTEMPEMKLGSVTPRPVPSRPGSDLPKLTKMKVRSRRRDNNADPATLSAKTDSNNSMHGAQRQRHRVRESEEEVVVEESLPEHEDTGSHSASDSTDSDS